MDIMSGDRAIVDDLPTAGPDLASKVQRFRRLHDGPDVLVLPNVWDAGSAALISWLPGVHAVATTSAGMAATHGLPDGECLSLDQMMAVVTQITRTVPVPVSVDLEAGYGHTASEVADSVASLIELGIVGVNIEDGVPGQPDMLFSPEVHVERVTAARAAGAQAGVPIVVNARTDTYWRGIGSPPDRFADTVRRLRRYRDAGADCLFVPGFPPRDLAHADRMRLIERLVGELDGFPVNLLAGPAVPSVPELRALGVRRLSVGSALYRLGMAVVLDAVEELLSSGRQESLADAGKLSYQQLADRLPEVERP